jgi:hypothetical protein
MYVCVCVCVSVYVCKHLDDVKLISDSLQVSIQTDDMYVCVSVYVCECVCM